MPAWAIIEQQQTILMVKRSERTSRPGQWCFPGGGIKATESPEQACIRECKEEVGLDVEVVKSMFNQSMGDVFLCRLVDRKQAICLNEAECADSAWVRPEELLSLGQIMDFKTVYSLLLEAGYQVRLNTDARKRLQN